MAPWGGRGFVGLEDLMKWYGRGWDKADEEQWWGWLMTGGWVIREAVLAYEIGQVDSAFGT